LPGLVVLTVLLPLAFLGLGVWERQRAPADLHQIEKLVAIAAGNIAATKGLLATAPGRLDPVARDPRYGQIHSSPAALERARDALGELQSTATLMRLRQYLPPVVIICAGLTAGLSGFALLATVLLGWRGRRSRDALVRGFSFVRHILPPLMAAQLVLVTLGVISVVAFEGSALLASDHLGSGGIKLLVFAVMAIGLSLWSAARAVLQLRRTLGLFTPDPLQAIGRSLSPGEAPGLWRIVDELASRLGALRPEHVVIGLDGGFYVASGRKLLQPGGTALEGRTLYLPLPYLVLLGEDEVAAIIGHELAHFAGGDTEYSLRFLPIYAGVGRSLLAMERAGMGIDGRVSLLIQPPLRLGHFAMERFHLAVRHWSRLREFAADAAGAQVVSPDAAARALLRTPAVGARIDDVLAAAFLDPASAPPDLVAAILQRCLAQGPDDPALHLEEAQPHPTDTHPSSRQRLAALGREPGPELLAAAAAPPPAGALSRLAAYFSEPEALCQAATEDFLQLARERAEAERRSLEITAAAVGPDAMALHENTRPGAIVLFVFGGLVLVTALALLVLGVPGVSGPALWSVTGAAGTLGLVFIGFGVPLLRRGDTPFLILRPEDMTVVGLDRPIAWADVRDVEMTVHQGAILTRVLLMRSATFPARLPRARRVQLDASRYSVTFRASPPRKLKLHGYADLVARYREADAARRRLAAEAAPASGAC